MIVSVPMMFYCYHAAVDGIANRLEKSVVVLWQLEVNAVHNKTTPPTIPSNSSTVSVPSYLSAHLAVVAVDTDMMNLFLRQSAWN